MSIIRSSWTRVLQLSQTKRNVIANLFGNGWAALLQLLAIPIYITLLGEQAYGLYAFYLTITGILQVFDFGFSPTINRELARLTATPERIAEASTLARTMELLYLLLGVVLGFVLALASSFLANTWLNTTLDAAAVQQVLLIMAILIVVQWPLTFYQGGINGLQKQTRLVTLQITMSTLKHGVGILLLLITPGILTLLTWFIIVTTLQSALSAFLLWKHMPKNNVGISFNIAALKPVAPFALGAALTSFASIPFTMAAPILLSGLVQLSEYGYYIVATTYAGVIAMIYMPVFTALYPRLTALIEGKNVDIVLNFFYLFGQFMALVVIPLGCALAIYANELLLIWQQDQVRASTIAPVAAIYVAVNVIAGLAHLPYAIQLAHGVTKINLALTVCLGTIQLPFLVWAINAYGILGAASVSFATHLLLLFSALALADLRVFRYGAVKWFINNLLLPAVVTGIVFATYGLFELPTSTIGIIVKLALSTATAIVLSAISMNFTRRWIVNKVQSARI
jgi:O-antigen/teichoic acid export membrane protein